MPMHSPFHGIPIEERERIQQAFCTFAQWDILTALAESPASVMPVVMLAQYTARRIEHVQRAVDALVACGVVETLIEDDNTVSYRLTRDEATRQTILHILAACTDWAYRKRLVQWICQQREPILMQEETLRDSS